MDFHGLIALVILPFLAWMLSEDRSQNPWRLIATAYAIEAGLALLLLKAPPFQVVFLWLNKAVLALERATEAGSRVIFGYLGGGPTPFDVTDTGANFILAFQSLPIILVMSALSALLFYWRILPKIVAGLAWIFGRALNISGAASLAIAANVFVGMVEAPLLVRPYIRTLTRSQLFAVMTTGMATIAGTMMVVYAGLIEGLVDNALGHIITASLMSVPAAIMMSRLMVPETETVALKEPLVTDITSNAHGAMEAITIGTIDGVKLLLNVIALILVMVALVSLVNQALGIIPDVAGAPLRLERILGWIMAPLVWSMGIPWSEAVTAGGLMGIKTVLNEFLAYLQLAALPDDALAEKSKLIMIYALNGFANLGSLGIMIGGLAAMAPDRRAEIAALGFKSIIAGTFATCLTGAVVGLLV